MIERYQEVSALPTERRNLLLNWARRERTPLAGGMALRLQVYGAYVVWDTQIEHLPAN